MLHKLNTKFKNLFVVAPFFIFSIFIILFNLFSPLEKFPDLKGIILYFVMLLFPLKHFYIFKLIFLLVLLIIITYGVIVVVILLRLFVNFLRFLIVHKIDTFLSLLWDIAFFCGLLVLIMFYEMRHSYYHSNAIELLIFYLLLGVDFKIFSFLHFRGFNNKELYNVLVFIFISIVVFIAFVTMMKFFPFHLTPNALYRSYLNFYYARLVLNSSILFIIMVFYLIFLGNDIFYNKFVSRINNSEFLKFFIYFTFPFFLLFIESRIALYFGVHLLQIKHFSDVIKIFFFSLVTLMVLFVLKIACFWFNRFLYKLQNETETTSTYILNKKVFFLFCFFFLELFGLYYGKHSKYHNVFVFVFYPALLVTNVPAVLTLFVGWFVSLFYSIPIIKSLRNVSENEERKRDFIKNFPHVLCKQHLRRPSLVRKMVFYYDVKCPIDNCKSNDFYFPVKRVIGVVVDNSNAFYGYITKAGGKQISNSITQNLKLIFDDNDKTFYLPLEWKDNKIHNFADIDEIVITKLTNGQYDAMANALVIHFGFDKTMAKKLKKVPIKIDPAIKFNKQTKNFLTVKFKGLETYVL